MKKNISMDNGQLPEGWEECSINSLYINHDRVNGGTILMGSKEKEWCIIFNKEGLDPIKHLKSREEAFSRFFEKIDQAARS